MKKIRLSDLSSEEILSKEELNSVVSSFSGSGSGSGRGSGSGSGRGSGSGSGTMPSGTLSSNGQGQVGTSFFAPYYATSVRFTCLANTALLPSFICRVKALGDWKSQTQQGALGVPTVIEISLDASNYNVSITFQTTDANGGICNWEVLSDQL